MNKLKMTELGPLPEEWELVKLGEVCDFKGGTQPPKSQFLSYPREGYIRLLQIRDFETDEYATYVPYSQKLRIVSEEDVLIARYGASVGKILRGKSGAINVALVKAIPDQLKLSKNFLFYLLQESRFQTFLKSLGGRSAQAGFNKGELRAFLIPLPPLPEQKAIARVLKTIQDAMEATERVIAAAKELKKSLMRHLFTYGPVPVSERDRVRLKETEIGPIPEDWEVVRLGEVVEIYDKLRIPVKEEDRQKQKKIYPYCGANGIIDYVENYIFEGEFVLLAEDGGYWGPLENSSYIMRGKFWVNNHAHVLKGVEEKLDNYFLMHSLNFLDLRGYVGGDSRGKITQGRLKRECPPNCVNVEWAKGGWTHDQNQEST